MSLPGHPVDLLAVLPDFAGGGAERVTLALANGLVRRNFRVRLVVFRAAGPLMPLCDPAIGIRVLERPRLRTALMPLVGEIRRCRPRVVFSSLGYVNLALLALRPMMPSEIRLWVREANQPSLSIPRSPIPRLMRAGYRLLYPRADRVICTSQRMREELEHDFAVPQAVIDNLFNPVDTNMVREHAVRPRRREGFGRRFVASGRMTVQKGFDRLLEMFADLTEDSNHLTILGAGPELDHLQELAERLGVAARVDLPGYVAEPWGWYAGADAFLLPSRWEGMPNAALEALACGTPVIATPEAGGIAEVAALSEPGAVKVLEAGPGFVAAMRATSQADRPVLRQSLLPREFELDVVLDQVSGWLKDRP